MTRWGIATYHCKTVGCNPYRYMYGVNASQIHHGPLWPTMAYYTDTLWFAMAHYDTTLRDTNVVFVAIFMYLTSLMDLN